MNNPKPTATVALAARSLAANVDLALWDIVLPQFAVFQRAGNLSEKTIANRQVLLRMLAHRTGRSPVDITTADLMAVMTRLHFRTGLPLSPCTKQAERSYLQGFFTWLQDEDYRPDDPAARLPRVKIPRRKPRPLRRAQVEALLDCGSYKRTRDIITIAALSGLRLGEIVKIRGEDIDVEGAALYSLRKGGLEHTVPLHPVIMQLAREYPKSGWWFPSPYKNKLFPNGGGHILMASASDAVSHALRKVGITDPRITGHSLRHFYATQLLAEGANVRVIQEMMGHASLATTQLYMGVTDGQMVEALNLLPGVEIRRVSGRKRALAEAGSQRKTSTP